MVKKPSNPNSFLKYSGLAFQIFGTLAVGAFIGNRLDLFFNTKTPIATVLCILVFFIAVMIWIYKDVQKTNDEV